MSNLDERQSRLAGFFAANFQNLSEIYSGILHVLHSDLFPNQCSVLAYQARELMENAPKEMAPHGATISGGPLTYAVFKKAVSGEYVDLIQQLKQTPIETENGRSAVLGFLASVEKWLLKAEQARPDYEKRARTHVALLEPGPAPPRGKALELAVRRWIALKGEFNDILHGHKHVGIAHVRSLVSELEDFFMLRIRPRPFENQARLEQFLARSPDDLDEREIEEMLGLIGALGVNYRYFFQNLDSPVWIGFLEAREFFKLPPRLLRIEGQIHAPDWPELAYLEHVVSDAEDEVGRIARDISHLLPENPRVHERLISIAAQLLRKGSRHGKELLNSELHWIAIQDRLPLRIPDLLLDAALAAASEIPGLALRATRSLLSLEVADEVRRGRSGKGWHRLGNWDLREILKRVSHDLPGALPASSQMYLLDVLCDFVTLVGENEFESTDSHLIDNAFLMWRPAIEDHEQNDLNSLSNWAVDGVRDIAEALIAGHGASVLQKLEERDSRTLLRVSLYLRDRYPNLDPDGTTHLVEDAEVVGDDVLRHELFRLLQGQFASFPDETRKRYLQWAMGLGNPYIRQIFLWPVRHVLPDPILESYQRHKEEFGDPENPDLSAHHGVSWIGPTSPFSVTEMESCEIPELVEKLNSWQYTPGDWNGPEPEGLARELAAYAARNPATISEQAIALEALQQPTFVRGITQGLADAVEKNQTVSWEPVLHFCTWATEQERGDGPEGSGLEQFDRTWGPARKQVAWLLRRGTEKGDAEIPFEFKDSVWSILKVLLQDPDPTEDEELSRAEYSDPSTIAINVTRGVALGATFSFVLWVTRHAPHEARTWIALELDGVRESLDEVLSCDHSPSVRSVFGKSLPYLFQVDQEWTESALDRIFPLSNEPVWTATWDAYLMFTSVLFVEFLELLRSSYEHALTSLEAERPEKTRPANPDEHLGHHLVLFLREGVLELNDPLLERFFEKASAHLRYSVMADAVRLIQDVAEEKRVGAVTRLQELWQSRYVATIDEKVEENHELSSFAWWFLKDTFPSEWRLQQLMNTQQEEIELHLDGRVLEEMIRLSEGHLPMVLDCLVAIVHNPANDTWGIYDDHVKEILTRALKSSDSALHDKAVDLVHFIGSLGHLDFRELLQE